MIHHCNRQAFIILVLFTVPFYHFLFSRYLGLTKRHFLSDILVPFPDSSDLYSRDVFYSHFVVSQGQLAASSNFIPAADIIQSYAQGFFCKQVLSMILNRFFPLQSLNWYLCQKKYSIQIPYPVNFRNVLPFCLICR